MKKINIDDITDGDIEDIRDNNSALLYLLVFIAFVLGAGMVASEKVNEKFADVAGHVALAGVFSATICWVVFCTIFQLLEGQAKMQIACAVNKFNKLKVKR